MADEDYVPTGDVSRPKVSYNEAYNLLLRDRIGFEGTREGADPTHEEILNKMKELDSGEKPTMAEDTGRFAAVAFQEAEDTGRPQPLSMGERKRIGAEVTRAAEAAGVGGSFTVPEGLDLEGANKRQDAAMQSIRMQSMSPEEILRDMKKSEQKSYGG